MKAFSILFSKFEQVIFIDADVLFMVDPIRLFDHPLFLKYGVLIYKDRQINLGLNQDTIKDHFPFASGVLQNSAIWNKTSSHLAESGVLVYDKSKFTVFFGLLHACNLNMEPMQTHTSKFFLGHQIFVIV